ncbi:Uncharacterized protein TPAR_03085 [Tolypocladium paradoxum]|uniref:Uncharacterized protein n=1 Tax=Tolypocladium paradoxum TaxID=94208 RepID=A0A2S4L2S9_9HYPO|nr:Uncharacterized protein TPAR_03085 [Tolypocladium paradoxum]
MQQFLPLCLLASIAFVYSALSHFLHRQPRSAATEPVVATTDIDIGECHNDETPQFRVRFDSSADFQVRGWPLEGGVYTLSPCSGVELDFLGLDRFHGTDSDEELHCNKMRQLGAVWWESEDEYNWSVVLPETQSNVTFIRVGWPATGGVWVLKATDTEACERGIGTLHNAYSMEQRCTVIEQLGGVLC